MTYPSSFGKVAVLLGGISAEHDISLKTGKAACATLLGAGIDAKEVLVDQHIASSLIDNNFDCAFIALHGRGGEDGAIQGLLETLKIPYTGSGVLASALAMDKMRSKAIWQHSQLPTPAAIELTSEIVEQDQELNLQLPLMIKPIQEGSSFGASKITQSNQLLEAWQQARHFDDRVMAEAWVDGDEYTVAILNQEALPVIQLKTPRQFYDYEAKYTDHNTQYLFPDTFNNTTEAELKALAIKASKALGVHGWCRVDLLVDGQGKAWLLELNTVPGLTQHSLVPMAAKKAGLSFETLVLRILETSCIQSSGTYCVAI